jgi:hypothetical protein
VVVPGNTTKQAVDPASIRSGNRKENRNPPILHPHKPMPLLPLKNKNNKIPQQETMPTSQDVSVVKTVSFILS